MPRTLQDIVEEFADAPRDLVLEMLLEYADALPPLPETPPELEQVVECQTPFFLRATVRPDGSVGLLFDCPPESPTTRAFAGILATALDGGPAEDVLAVPSDIYQRMGLAQAISPLRLRGGGAILSRLQRQVREQLLHVKQH